MSKYSKLTQYLAALSVSETTMSFSQVEAAMGSALPPSAYEYRPWWANRKDGNGPHSSAWQAAGFETKDVQLDLKRVTFSKVARLPNVALNAPQVSSVRRISISEAKAGLAAFYEVDPSNIEINIRG